MIARISRLREALDAQGYGAYVSVFAPDNQYLSGFITDFGEISSAIIVTQNEAVFLTDSRYTEQAQLEVSGYEIVQIKGDLLARAGERIEAMTPGRTAYDPGGLTVDEYERLISAYHGEMAADKNLLRAMRLRKSDEETGRIRAASQLAEGVLADLAPQLEEGLPEQELAAQFEYEFKKRGAQGASFSTIALFGERSSLPHGIPGSRRLRRGDIVLLDLGCRLGGYCSDLTRTFAFGTIPEPWFEEIYAVTSQAQRAALDAVKPGAACRDIDALARGLIAAQGFGERFGHGLGHGVGIQIHEAPRLNPTSEDILEPGMIVTIEPGIYLPGKGGVRIEDLVAVTESGCEVLTASTKELRVL